MRKDVDVRLVLHGGSGDKVLSVLSSQQWTGLTIVWHF